MNEKNKDRVITAATGISFIIAGVLFWEVIRAIMWMCYVAGIPM